MKRQRNRRTSPAPCLALPEFPCTSCGGDAYVGMSNLRASGGRVLIRKDERLCMACAMKRGGFNPFAPNKGGVCSAPAAGDDTHHKLVGGTMEEK